MKNLDARLSKIEQSFSDYDSDLYNLTDEQLWARVEKILLGMGYRKALAAEILKEELDENKFLSGLPHGEDMSREDLTAYLRLGGFVPIDKAFKASMQAALNN